MRTLLMIVSSTILWTCCNYAQSYEQLLLGKWKGTVKETKNGNRKLKDGRDRQELGVYEFKSNGIAIDYTLYPDKTQIKYFVKGNLLQLGYLTFKIEKLNGQELVIIDYNEQDPNDPLSFRHFFKKEK